MSGTCFVLAVILRAFEVVLCIGAVFHTCFQWAAKGVTWKHEWQAHDLMQSLQLPFSAFKTAGGPQNYHLVLLNKLRDLTGA